MQGGPGSGGKSNDELGKVNGRGRGRLRQAQNESSSSVDQEENADIVPEVPRQARNSTRGGDGSLKKSDDQEEGIAVRQSTYQQRVAGLSSGTELIRKEAAPRSRSAYPKKFAIRDALRRDVLDAQKNAHEAMTDDESCEDQVEIIDDDVVDLRKRGYGKANRGEPKNGGASTRPVQLGSHRLAGAATKGGPTVEDEADPASAGGEALVKGHRPGRVPLASASKSVLANQAGDLLGKQRRHESPRPPGDRLAVATSSIAA